jgi:tetratricopeptide (TPR) repeat protein
MNSSLAQHLAGARRLADVGRKAEALKAYEAILAADPAYADGWYEYAWLLRRTGQPDDALAAYAVALSSGIRGAEEVHLNRAVIFSEDLAQPGEALAELQRALACRPDYAPALLNLGKLREDLGDSRTAADIYLRLSGMADGGDLALEALARLVQIELPTEATPDRLQRLRREANNPALPSALRADLWFALGHCLEARQDYDSAFEAFVEANRRAAVGHPAYQPAAMERHADAVLAAAPPTPSLFARGEGAAPLFICGMFRSGSTLLEQVLHSHPQISAGGELSFFPRMASGPLAAYATGCPLPSALAERVRSDYLAVLAQVAKAHPAKSVRFVTDKRPDNVLLLALIRQAFADARIVITRRNPLDTGLSVFQQHLSPIQASYSSELASIGHYQAQVHRITEHCRGAWPDSVRVFDYDAFVRDPELELRPLLEWLGLPWDSACLRFHEQRNTVATASHAQVRRPLYRESSGRWRRYEKNLTPLHEALSRHGYPIDA